MKMRLRTSLLLLVLITLSAQAAHTPKDYIRWQNYPSAKLMQMGSNYADMRNMPDSALVCFSIVSSRYQKNLAESEREYVIEAFNGKWFIYFFTFFDYPKSYECLMRAEELCNEFGQNKCRVYLNFGCMYQTLAEQSNDDKLNRHALNYYRLSVAEAKKNGNSKAANNCLENMITVASSLNMLDSIRTDIQAAKSWVEKDIPQDFSFTSQFFEGMTAIRRKDYARAMDAFSQLERLLVVEQASAQYRYYKYIILVNKAKVASLQGNPDEAIQLAKTAEQIAVQYDMKDAKIEVYNHLIQYYQQLGKTELAEQYRNSYFRIKDTLLNYHQLASVQEMKFLGEMKKIDEQMVEMRHTSLMKSIIIGIVVVIALIIAVFLWLMKRKNKILQDNNRSLYQRYIEMTAAEEKERRERHEKEQLLAEMKQDSKPEKYKNSTLDNETREQLLGRIRQVLGEETEEICSPSFSLDRLAELVQSNYKYVSQVINEQPGTNFNTMVNNYRIREACKRMNNVAEYGNLTIEAIANGVGFKSSNAFRASFKRVTGLTPSEFQRQANANQ